MPARAENRSPPSCRRRSRRRRRSRGLSCFLATAHCSSMFRWSPAGKISRISVPDPGALSAFTRPPCASTVCRTIASPSPVPPALWVTYGSQIVASRSGGAFVQTKPVVQVLSAGGGWANGDAEFIGQNPPQDAVITYYLQKRHIFGDMKLQLFDSAGKLVQSLPTGKRRGLSRT